jgi:hypothetical protein
MSGPGIRGWADVSADLPAYRINLSWVCCVLKELQRDSPLTGVRACSPSYSPPFLK